MPVDGRPTRPFVVVPPLCNDDVTTFLPLRAGKDADPIEWSLILESFLASISISSLQESIIVVGSYMADANKSPLV